jgi:hypothetical protein
MQIIGEVSVIGQVTDQKKGGGDKCRYHAVAVRPLLLAADEIITPTQENRA